jgi:hypothetical protein
MNQQIAIKEENGQRRNTRVGLAAENKQAGGRFTTLGIE